MSRTLFSVGNLETPFEMVMEKSFLVPVEGHPVVSNRRKIVFFLECDGQHRFQNGALHALHRGDVLIVPARCRQFYKGAAQTQRIHALCLFFDGETLPLLPAEREFCYGYSNPETDMTDFCQHHFQRNCHLPNACDSAVMEALGQIRLEAERASTGYRLRIASLCQTLVIFMARLLGEDKNLIKETDKRGGAYIVTCAKDFLQTNLNKQFGLDQVAAHLQISPEHLARVFKQITGQSVFSHLKTIRLEQAKLLLLNSDKNVSEIAAISGFSSLPLFSRNFKEHTGLSPLSYRREYGGNTPT